jgi:DNA end-binding protein Ku
MPRAIWTGAISFGLVTIPVKLYTAVQSKTVRFNQLDGDDGSRVQMKRVNAQTGEEVPYERIVKGYELSPDRYVVIDPDELEALDPKKTKTIDIEGFVDIEDIDPIYFDHPYYLVPGPGGAKPYRLLVDAMKETGKAAIAKVVIRSKEQLVVLRPIGDVLGMTTMNFHDEVVDAKGLDEVPAADDIKTTDRELAIARQLVDSLSEPFEPERYHDTYREQVLDLIERKAAGEEIAVQPAREESDAPVPDLMSALKASLDAVRERTGGDGDGDGAATKKRAPARKRSGAGSSSGGSSSGGSNGTRKAPAKKPSGGRKATAKKS